MSFPRTIGYVGLAGLSVIAILGGILFWRDRDWYGLLVMAGFCCLIGFLWHGLRTAAARERNPQLAAASGLGWEGQSVWAFFRGPVIQTPQGLVFLIASGIYFACGIALLLAGDSFAAPASVKNYWIGCFFAPVILFLLFVRTNGPSFAPSGANAAWGLFLAVMPILVAWLR